MTSDIFYRCRRVLVLTLSISQLNSRIGPKNVPLKKQLIIRVSTRMEQLSGSGLLKAKLFNKK